ncbi:MAG TPA: OmpA family protein [Polyangiaceae bacterium]|nr:OmpA family protein [Polyangiaceae bacterium]
MRPLLLVTALVLAAGSPGHVSSVAFAAGEKGAQRQPALELSIDPADVDLARGQLTARLSRPAAKVTLKVLALSGAVLTEVEQAFDGAAAGSPLVVRWQAPAEAVARIEVFGHDTDGYYKGIAITPWSFEVPHEDVGFATDSAEITPGEEKKLVASLRLIEKQLPLARRLGEVSLYVLAHTDTVGSAEYNLGLSTRRAQAIARWFRKHGLRIPIAYDGVGESMLKVKTADEVDEPRNRRVDYMLGVEPPRFQRSGAAPSWKRS